MAVDKRDQFKQPSKLKRGQADPDARGRKAPRDMSNDRADPHDPYVTKQRHRGKFIDGYGQADDDTR